MSCGEVIHLFSYSLWTLAFSFFLKRKTYYYIYIIIKFYKYYVVPIHYPIHFGMPDFSSYDLKNLMSKVNN